MYKREGNTGIYQINQSPKSVENTSETVEDGNEGYRRYGPSNNRRASSSPIFRVARLASSFSVLYLSYSTSLVLIFSIYKLH